MTTPGVQYDAVLLAGGRASRMSGIDKTALVADGLALSDHAVAAAARARSVVLVGLRDGRTAPDGVVVTREDPPFGGPVAGIAAGLVAVPEPAPWTLVLACDLVRPSGRSTRCCGRRTTPPTSTASSPWTRTGVGSPSSPSTGRPPCVRPSGRSVTRPTLRCGG